MTRFENDAFLRACWRKETEYTPVWFMRQAGRYLESYRKLRAKHDVLTICKTPELSAEATTGAVSELGVDAAIVFADIMLPLEGIGVKFKLVDGVGPVVQNPIRNRDGVERLGHFSPEEHVPYVLDSLRLIKNRLNDRIPVIGFSGAPFTLASYLIEGSPSRDFTETKKMMYSNPETWKMLLSRLSTIVTDYLKAQVKGGADAVQLFDSWSGALSPTDYEEFVLPHNKKILDGLSGSGVPRIHFGVGTAGILKKMQAAGGDVFGVDWRIAIEDAWKILGDVAIQGNQDPASLLGSEELMLQRAQHILDRVAGRPGHVFNLGHGVLPETSPEHARRLVQFVHDSTRRRK